MHLRAGCGDVIVSEIPDKLKETYKRIKESMLAFGHYKRRADPCKAREHCLLSLKERTSDPRCPKIREFFNAHFSKNFQTTIFCSL